MLKNFFLIVLTFTIFSSQTFATTGNGLKTAFDEFNYAISVEWDQKDQRFYEAAKAKLESKIREAQSRGASNGEFIDALASYVHSEDLKAELQYIRTQTELGLLSSNEIAPRIQEILGRSYQKGASWISDAAFLTIVGVVFVAFLVAYIACVSDPNSVTVCRDYGYCSSWDDYCEAGTTCGCRR